MFIIGNNFWPFIFFFLKLFNLSLTNKYHSSIPVLKDDVEKFSKYEIQDLYYVSDHNDINPTILKSNSGFTDIFLLISIIFGTVAIFVIIVIAVFFIFSKLINIEKRRLSKELTIQGLSLNSESDRKMAHSAQMFNYQMQKTKLLEEEKLINQSSDSSEEEYEQNYLHEESFVFGSPGLASIHEIELSNPMVIKEVVNKKHSQ